ncbi:hypothetical protein KC365_g18755 [Hortaea werneckii]|nr:hypothetical protein KC342_g18829 [Hortaea werneckii]KAI7054324.1 hypothetical protein KC339_g18565 [Hortaea werneckii]KAI7201277.1 hypothetical protein KC365_g18755 [Hortaea werneckii]
MDFNQLIANAMRSRENSVVATQRRKEADQKRRAQPEPPPRSSLRKTGSSESLASSASRTSNVSRSRRASDVMDLDPPAITPRSTRGSQRGSPIKRASESPEKEQRPQKRVSSSVSSETTANLPLEEAAASLSLVSLLMPDGSHRPLSDLEDQRALENHWNSYMTRDALFRRWWDFQQSKTHCCGGKVIAKSEANWEDGRFACKTCLKTKRACLRLTTPVSEDGQRLTRLVEVMPENGKDGLQAFEYF